MRAIDLLLSVADIFGIRIICKSLSVKSIPFSYCGNTWCPIHDFSWILNKFIFFHKLHFFVCLTDRILVHWRTSNHCDCSFFFLRKVLWHLMCILKCHSTLQNRRRMNKRSNSGYYSNLEFPKLTLSRICLNYWNKHILRFDIL